MPNLAQNPYEAALPNYLLDHFFPTRQPLVEGFDIMQEEVAQHLMAIWQAQNTLDCQKWDAEQQQHAQEEEHNAILWDEQKKNWNKFLPFADTQISIMPPILSSSLALWKLCKGKYCKLFFLPTKTWLMPKLSLALTQDDQGLHTFIPIVATRVKQSVIEDKDLSWAQIDESTHHILQAMKENRWDQKHIDSHLQFWMALGAHEWRHDPDKTTKQALIIYQATVWK
ncbi:hypothetical protein V8B97DRAFT_2026431 [Scleroderma yunnanense]